MYSLDYGTDVIGAFDKLSDGHKKLVLELAAIFHFRNGVKNHDGSLGTIKITPKQLINCLAAMSGLKEECE